MGGNVGEGSVAVGAVEDVWAEVGDVEVEVSVGVVVAHSDAHAVAVVSDAGGVGDIGERQLSGWDEIVAEEAVAGRLVLGRRERWWLVAGVEGGALQEVDVEVAVVVVVEERDAGSGDFRQVVFAGGSGDVLKAEAGCFGGFAEDRGWWFASLLSRGSCAGERE